MKLETPLTRITDEFWFEEQRKKKVYIIGSLRNPEVPGVARLVREAGFEAFDDWMAAGPEADDYWRDYEKVAREHTYAEALKGYAARHVFSFDKHHLDTSDAAILVLPAGKSGHLELGYLIGSSKPGYILLDEDPERFDVMYQFAKIVTNDIVEILNDLHKI